jgi:hypothetical protein
VKVGAVNVTFAVDEPVAVAVPIVGGPGILGTESPTPLPKFIPENVTGIM